MIASELKLALSEALPAAEKYWQEVPLDGDEGRLLDYLMESGDFPRELNKRSLLYLFKRIYGDHEELLRDKLIRLNNLCDLFLNLFGDGPITLLRAPARINVLGEHIDYVSYIPTASLSFGSRERDMLMLYRVSETARVRGASSSEAYHPVSFTLDEGPPHPATSDTKNEWLSYLYEHPAPSPNWDNYVKGGAYFARMKFGEHARLGFDFAVDSNIPPGGGASSSSALVVLAGAATREVNHIKYTPEELARDSATAEWYVGTRGGAMDHITICLARTSRAVRISYWKSDTRRVSMPGQYFQWITFFSKAADKGREVMIEYNERAAVSRLLIPAVINGWKIKQPDRYSIWSKAVESFALGSVAALEQIETLIMELPETLALTTVEQDYPDTFSECERAFPALVKERRNLPLQVRSRALHHLGEVRRGVLATNILDSIDSGSDAREHISAMRSLGTILSESHQSLRDLYGVSTPEVERLVEIIRSDPNVYGAHLMGGGFGGNVLALTSEEYVSALTEKVQHEYYEPRERHGVREGSVMISTPGTGLASLSLHSVWREAIEEFNSFGHAVPLNRAKMLALLDKLQLASPQADVWPVIVAAGKGDRARATGMELPKPLALIAGTPAIVHVLNNVRSALGRTRSPVVIVSPQTELAVREALAHEEVTFVVQPRALGTGDAVLSAHEQMRDFQGMAFVIWSTQPVIRPITMQRAIKLAALFDDYEMTLPTALKNHAYAPLHRDGEGHVRSARETHLERAEQADFGETNIGLFILKNQTMFQTLLELKQCYWNESQGRYERPGYELGFPNELINFLGQRETGVFACPIADSREEQGIKEHQDLESCEEYISELQQRQS